MSKLDKIFRAYDIRGIYSKEINEKIAYKIGRAVAEFLISETQASSFKLETPSTSFRKMKEVEPEYLVIGRDNRLSSEKLFKVLCEGVRDQGVNVIDTGISTTPMLYFAVAKWKTIGGIMITASHNPPQYNGFKIVRDRGISVGEKSGLEKIKKLAEKDKFQDWNRGQIQSKEIFRAYIKNILSLAETRTINPFKIVVDTSNGTAGLVIPELFKKMPACLADRRVNLIHIFAKLDGSFPNHNPNPANPENTRALQEKVLSEKADLGIAFDGDGDRIFFIDEKGERINPNLIFALLLKNFFPNQGKILYDVTSSRIVKEEIRETGNIPICSEVGHTFVKEKMREEDIIFGAESSGHYYFKDNYFIESPFIVLLKVLGILSKTKMPLSELVKPFQKYYQERINIRVKNLKEKIKEIEKKYKKGAKISYLDGLSVEFEDWWFNIRPSHTEPVIRLTIEVQAKELLEQKKKELNELLKN
jgi:phosphomannomutase